MMSMKWFISPSIDPYVVSFGGRTIRLSGALTRSWAGRSEPWRLGESVIGTRSSPSVALLAPVHVRRGIDRAPGGVHVDRAARDQCERLLHNPHGLLHLGHPDEVPGVVVAVLLCRDLEHEPVVHIVGPRPPHVVRDTDRAE